MRFQYFYVYILSNKQNGTLYVGVTQSIAQRMRFHRKGIHKGFTKEYSVYRLVYIERYRDVLHAIRREKVLKKWRRSWKIELIEKKNYGWEELCNESGELREGYFED